jgi:hypothetical protein
MTLGGALKGQYNQVGGASGIGRFAAAGGRALGSTMYKSGASYFGSKVGGNITLDSVSDLPQHEQAQFMQYTKMGFMNPIMATAYELGAAHKWTGGQAVLVHLNPVELAHRRQLEGLSKNYNKAYTANTRNHSPSSKNAVKLALNQRNAVLAKLNTNVQMSFLHNLTLNGVPAKYRPEITRSLAGRNMTRHLEKAAMNRNKAALNLTAGVLRNTAKTAEVLGHATNAIVKGNVREMFQQLFIALMVAVIGLITAVVRGTSLQLAFSLQTVKRLGKMDMTDVAGVVLAGGGAAVAAEALNPVGYGMAVQAFTTVLGGAGPGVMKMVRLAKNAYLVHQQRRSFRN